MTGRCTDILYRTGITYFFHKRLHHWIKIHNYNTKSYKRMQHEHNALMHTTNNIIKYFYYRNVYHRSIGWSSVLLYHGNEWLRSQEPECPMHNRQQCGIHNYKRTTTDVGFGGCQLVLVFRRRKRVAGSDCLMLSTAMIGRFGINVANFIHFPVLVWKPARTQETRGYITRYPNMLCTHARSLIMCNGLIIYKAISIFFNNNY